MSHSPCSIPLPEAWTLVLGEKQLWIEEEHSQPEKYFK